MSSDDAAETICGCLLWLMLLAFTGAVTILCIALIIQALRWISNG